MDAGPGQKFGDDLFVGFGVLPHIQTAQVEPESLNRISEANQSVIGEKRAAVGPQRGIDDTKIGEHLIGISVRR